MRPHCLFMVLACALAASTAPGQTPVATIMLPDSLGGMSCSRGIWLNPLTNTCYVGGDPACIVAVDAASMRRVARIEDCGDREDGFGHPVRNKVYAFDIGEGRGVLVVDGATNQVVRTVVTDECWESVCWNPVSDKLYGCAASGAAVEVLDCSTDEIVATIPAGGTNELAALCSAGTLNKVYAAGDCGVLVIDGTSDSVLAVVPWVPTCGPAVAVYNPATNRVYAAGDDGVEVIDAVADTVVRVVAREDWQPVQAFANGRRVAVYFVELDGYLTTFDCRSDCFTDRDYVGEYWLEDPPTTSVAYDSLTESFYAAVDEEGGIVLCRYSISGRSRSYVGLPSDLWRFVVDPSGRTAYCLANPVTRLWKVDLNAESVVGSVSLGALPSELWFSEATRKLYSLSRCDQSLTVIDPATNRPLRALDLPSAAGTVLGKSDGAWLYLLGGRWLHIVDGIADTVAGTLDLGCETWDACYVESHGKLYCRGYLSAELVVVDCEAESVIRHIQLPSRPGDLAYNSTHDRLYVSCPGSNCVLVIDCGADTVVAEVRAYETPVALLYSAPDDRLYVTTARGLFVLDCGPDTALARLEPDCSCLRLAYNPLHNKVYAIGPAVAGLSDIVAVIDGDDERVVAQIPLPRHADKALYNPVSDRLYITTYRDGVWVIDGATDRLIAHAGLDDPWALALNCRDNRIYVGDGWSSTITVLQDGEPSILSNPAVSSPAFVVRLGATIGTRGARLHDVSGRVVRELLPGASSLTGIMPGVYFLRERGGVERKLVVVR